MSHDQVIRVQVRTSKNGALWPGEYWKTLFDSLGVNGSKHDPRRVYPDLASSLDRLIHERNGRFYPQSGGPLSDFDDSAIQVIEITQLAPGQVGVSVDLVARPVVTPSVRCELPCFGTIGDSVAERQTKANRQQLGSVIGSVPDATSAHVQFRLASSRRDRDLDNLFDALAPVFRERFPRLRSLLLVKGPPWDGATELFECAWNGTAPASAGKLTSLAGAPPSRGVTPAVPAETPATKGGSAMTAKEAIREAMTALGGEADGADVKRWIEARYPGKWKDITTHMADLTVNGNKTSTYKEPDKCLERVSRGRYRMIR